MLIQKFLVDLQLSEIFDISSYTRVWQPTAKYVEMLLKTSPINPSQTLGFEDGCIPSFNEKVCNNLLAFLIRVLKPNCDGCITTIHLTVSCSSFSLSLLWGSILSKQGKLWFGVVWFVLQGGKVGGQGERRKSLREFFCSSVDWFDFHIIPHLFGSLILAMVF